MKTYTLLDIHDLKPCYPATEHLPEGWTGTLVDMLRVESCPLEDRIWVVTQFLDNKTNRLFAVWCAREALKLVDNPDIRSIAACDVAERYAHGNATNEELRIAYDAASAAWDADYAAAWDTRDAARAARAAVTRTVMTAVEVGVARVANRAATRQAQIDKLIEMIEELV